MKIKHALAGAQKSLRLAINNLFNTIEEELTDVKLNIMMNNIILKLFSIFVLIIITLSIIWIFSLFYAILFNTNNNKAEYIKHCIKYKYVNKIGEIINPSKGKRDSCLEYENRIIINNTLYKITGLEKIK